MADQPSGDPTTGATGRLRLRYTALSDVGRVRKDNQDSGYAGEHLLAIADGVGGSARGDVASSAAIGELRALDEPPGNDLQGALAEAIERSHRQIAGLVEQHPELDGTSTTVTAAVFDGTRVGVGHVGDSRGYLLRDGAISQITKDHTFVQSLIDEGRITEEESRVHPHRNLILRAVDGKHEPEPDLFLVDVVAGDRILLCSDGASGVLATQDMARILGTGTVENAAVELIRAALDAGSSDNVTVVVADVTDAAVADPEETGPVALGPIVVGAAAEKRKGLSSRKLRAMRRSDTGELDPVPAEARHAGRPRGAPLRTPATASVHVAAPDPGARCDRCPGLACRLDRLRLDPEAVLRRPGRRHGRDLPGCPGAGAGGPAPPRLPAERGQDDRPPRLHPGPGPRRHRCPQPRGRTQHRGPVAELGGVRHGDRDTEPVGVGKPVRHGHEAAVAHPEPLRHQEADGHEIGHEICQPDHHTLWQPLAHRHGHPVARRLRHDAMRTTPRNRSLRSRFRGDPG